MENSRGMWLQEEAYLYSQVNAPRNALQDCFISPITSPPSSVNYTNDIYSSKAPTAYDTSGNTTFMWKNIVTEENLKSRFHKEVYKPSKRNSHDTGRKVPYTIKRGTPVVDHMDLKTMATVSSPSEDSVGDIYVKDIIKDPNRGLPLNEATYRCKTCAKAYKHKSGLLKHNWEHTVYWELAQNCCVTKHQSVQLLEAAKILFKLQCV